MKALAITNSGIEDICCQEISEIIGVKGNAEDGCVIFEAKIGDLCKLCYKAQSVSRVIVLLDSFEFSFDNLKESIGRIDFSEWIDDKKTFVVRCKHIGEHDFSSNEVERQAGEFILGKVNAKVKLECPDVTFLAYIYNAKCYLGVDLAGDDLSKRDYKIFSTPLALKGTVAYALVRIAGFGNGILLDPFAHDGTIAIEAALFASGMSPHFYKKDKFAFRRIVEINLEQFDGKREAEATIHAASNSFNHINNTKKNAKIAGINKLIKFTRTETEWIDLKYGERSINSIVTLLPQAGRHASERDVARLYREMFYNGEFVLKEGGKIVAITMGTSLLRKEAEEHKFRVIEERVIMQGKAKFTVLVFAK